MLIGQVAEADLRTERALRHVWLELVGDGPGRNVVPTGVPRLIEQCKAMLPERGIGTRAEAGALLVLGDAKTAHEQRNRIAHDAWLPRVVDGVLDEATLSAARFKPHQIDPDVSVRTVADAQVVLRTFARVIYRLIALHLLLIRDYGDDPDGLEEALATLENQEEFTVTVVDSTATSPARSRSECHIAGDCRLAPA